MTGGARGIGKVYAEGIAAEGAKVVVSDIRDGEETAEGIRAADGDAVFVQCDVSRGESCDTLARAAQDRYGRIDGLVNNAALYADLKYVPFDQIEEEEWDRVFAVNVKGVWLMTRAVYAGRGIGWKPRRRPEEDRQHCLGNAFQGHSQYPPLCRLEGGGRDPDPRDGPDLGTGGD